ncbi:Hypothetical predicted protein [Cloeon dipterum]|uniref:BTB domain-containing protein n=1 Tax=Cloeon dipterum TaxID=197152 RepID=A0A8S1DBE0_9INSE|nr:Hypothetical predicted protein [Cloeon dipterum]
MSDEMTTNDRDNFWKRHGDIVKDELELYKSSLYYDCTFRIGDTNPQIFKCHKVILARASGFFANLLYGTFKETNLDKDDPMEHYGNVRPEAFDLAMRFIYGNETDFKTVELASEVYVLAQSWAMESLMTASAEFFKNVEPKDVLILYDMYKFLNNDTVNWEYYRILKRNTSEVFNSPHWIKATPSTILEICEMKKLKIKSEGEIFQALLKWGEENCNNVDKSDMREKIDSALKLVHFRAMSAEEFSELSLTTKVLTAEEKLQILLSISLGKSELMPTKFSMKNQFRSCDSALNLDLNSFVTSDISVKFDSPISNFKFRIESNIDKIYLSSFNLLCLTADLNDGLKADLQCLLWSSCPDEPLATVKVKRGIDSSNSNEIFLPRPMLLQNGIFYNLTIRYLHIDALKTKKLDYPPTLVWNLFGNTVQLHRAPELITHNDIQSLQFQRMIVETPPK